MRGSSAKVSAGSVRRFGPMVRKGRRIPMRGKKTGSVRIFIPKKLMRTVECPSHAAVRSSLLQVSGAGCANAGAIGRRLSTIHSCQRWPSQLRRRISRRAASRSDSIKLITPTVAAVCDRRAWGVAQSSAVIDRRYSINIAPLALNRYGLAETLDHRLVNWLEKIIAAKGDEILAAKER